MSSGLNGSEVFAALRRKSDIPMIMIMIMITATGEVHAKIGALYHGANDYVINTYNP